MKVTILKGENLWEALKQQNVILDLPCAGNGTCGQCTVEVVRFGKVKSCQFRLPGTYEVTIPKQQQFTAVGTLYEKKAEAIWNPEYTEESGWDKQPVAAVDIGTTTVAIIVCYRGRQTFRSFTNPQRVMGADVMSRIRFASEGQAEVLQQMLRKRLDEELFLAVSELSEEEKICRVIIGANTTMIHILCGWSCEGLGKAPFTPFSLEREERERHLGDGFLLHETLFPGISAFIGADIVSGIYAIGMIEETEPMLLLDLGTNGEMALGCAERIVTASAAAGPAFEGSDLAVQIHASGVLHCLCTLRENDVVDETGLLAEPYFTNGFPISNIAGIGVVADDLCITQEDIRQLQMAKAAIRAGIEILLNKYGISAKEVKHVYLAGGMGYYLNPDDAVSIGLLPESFLGKTSAAGNTSLLGALRYAKEPLEQADKQISQIREKAEEIILSTYPAFEEFYIGYMNL